MRHIVLASALGLSLAAPALAQDKPAQDKPAAPARRGFGSQLIEAAINRASAADGLTRIIELRQMLLAGRTD